MTWRLAVVCAATGIAFLHQGVKAQATTPSLPEYTTEQRWGRLATLDLSWIASEVALGKSRGMTIDEIGKFLGAYFADSWAGGLDARSLFTSFRWNILSHPNSRIEVIHFSDSLVTARFNTPVLGAFGPDRLYYALSLDEYRTLFLHINRSIAERVGVALEQRYDGDWLVVSMRNGYKLPQPTPQLRWERAAFINLVNTIETVRVAKAAGKSPRDAGLEGARLWADTWSATDTPWRLLSTWTWNHMVHPNYVCEMQSANATMVKARCNRPWEGTVRANAERTKVSVDDFNAYQLAMEQGIAQARGMTWDVTMDGDYRVITVQKRR